MSILDELRGRMKIARPIVVTETLPSVQHVGFARFGEGCKIGKSAKPFIIIGNDRRDLRLLEHQLRDQDRVGIVGLPPREVAFVVTIPAKKRATESLGVQD